MENKISAQDLYDLMLDTNQRVASLEKHMHTRGMKQRSGGLGKRLIALLLLFGVALIVTIFCSPLRTWLNIELSAVMWDRIYLIYTMIALLIVFILDMKRVPRFAMCLMAIAPVVCNVIYRMF